MSNSRIDKSLKNSIAGVMSTFLILIITFISRKIFAYTLGTEILGLNSFFQNIIAMLTITEAGLSTSIIFFLYEPIANKNYEKIKTLMNFSRKLYLIIASIISFVGILIFFNIQLFVNTDIDLRTLRLYFLLYLISTVVTYFYSYKKSILYADQENRIVTNIHTLCKVSFEIVQIIVVMITYNYFLYLILLIFFNFFENILCSYIVDKRYLFLNHKYTNKLSKREEKKLLSKFKDMLIQNLSNFLVNSTDNIIISSFINVSIVGLYSNYNLITQTLRNFYSAFSASFTTSFGNMSVVESKEKCFDIYNHCLFFTFCFSSVTSIIYLNVVQTFMKIWMGYEFVLPNDIAVLLVISYYISNMNIPSISVQNALGYHNYDNTSMILQAITNLIISIFLVKIIGIAGVILGTIISTLLFPTISKPYILYKYFFKKNKLQKHFKKLTAYAFLTIVMYWGNNKILSYFSFANIYLDLVVKGIIGFSLSTLFIFIIFKNTKDFKYFILILKKLYERRIKNV